MNRRETRSFPGFEGFHRPSTLGHLFHFNTFDGESAMMSKSIMVNYSSKEGSGQHSSSRHWQAVRTWGSPPAPRFLSWVRFPPRGTVPNS